MESILQGWFVDNNTGMTRGVQLVSFSPNLLSPGNPRVFLRTEIHRHTSWVRRVFDPAHLVCCRELLLQEQNMDIKKLMATAAAAGILLTACGGQSQEATKTTETETPVVESEETTEVEETTTSEAPAEGEAETKEETKTEKKEVKKERTRKHK